jgi:DNA-binding transcriptional ArsR family regulator
VEVISSKGRLKIIKVLLESNELNVSEIARRTGLNHSAVNKHLRVLEREGIARKRVIKRVKMYSINEQDPRVGMLRKLLEYGE